MQKQKQTRIVQTRVVKPELSNQDLHDNWLHHSLLGCGLISGFVIGLGHFALVLAFGLQTTTYGFPAMQRNFENDIPQSS
jgi:hypothetical protein